MKGHLSFTAGTCKVLLDFARRSREFTLPQDSVDFNRVASYA